MVRAYNDLERSELIWNLWKQQTENTAGSALKNSFHSIPAEIFLPMNTEIIQRQIGIVNALSIPGYTFQAPSMGIGSGMSFDFYKAGVFLGIFEDVSPTIKYDLSITADVVVVVYSIQAKAIATLFNGMQTPGSYTVTWNGRDDQGKKMEMGDYFIEVKIGTEKFVRKRVRIGDYK